MTAIFSHYDFIDAVLPSLWEKVRGTTLEQDWCSGIVSAHGDKCYGYKHEWQNQGIHFYVGALIFLFSYSSPKPTNPIQLEPLEVRHSGGVSRWVVRQYNNEEFLNAIKSVCTELNIDFPQL